MVMTLRLVSIITLTLLVATLVSVLIMDRTWAGRAAFDTNSDLSTQEKYWIDHIKANGGDAAYSAFAEAISDVPPSRQHTLAHVMGGALYKAMGTDGLFICTSDYSYGCYHEFLGRAIHEGGLPVIESLSSACASILKSQSLGCQHGIGHGILGYFGYDIDSLIDSLAVCESLGDETISHSCFGGVFMEYNTETLLADQASTRAFDPELGYMYPCSTFDSSWQAPCYFWQIQWWLAIDRYDHPELSDRVDLLNGRCANIGDEHSRRECFRGIGYNLPGEAGYDASAVRDLCQRLTSKVGQVECAAGSAGSLLANPGSASVGYTVCDALEDSDRAYCVRTANDPH